MNLTENIQENVISAIIIWMFFLSSIICSKFYQQERVKYDLNGKLHIFRFNKWRKTLWTVAIVIGPSVLIGIRGFKVGADTHNYVQGYSRVVSGLMEIFPSKFPLFNLFRYAINIIANGNPTVFLFSMAFLTLFIFIRLLING